ncbi:hypothetical protein F3Y22_tig00111640pilonHSYRG00205 [Hibiscus syriacus]|uniref:Uncharacterized protein n=1 Tax=Hibiscus syriacus TaxID=106335 RepID=A0A6A2XIE6_HIBSY|nr:hypothetical protein F3Y22_tig00111640pilonHSYRG00205 [Hibiscus syriacus]
MLGVPAAANCRSDKEKDWQGGFSRLVDDNDVDGLVVVDFYKVDAEVEGSQMVTMRLS